MANRVQVVPFQKGLTTAHLQQGLEAVKPVNGQSSVNGPVTSNAGAASQSSGTQTSSPTPQPGQGSK